MRKVAVRDEQVHKIEGACVRLGVSRSWLYVLMDNGKVPFFHVGRVRLIKESAITAYLAGSVA